MKILNKIHKTYMTLDDEYARKENEAMTKLHTRKVLEWEGKRFLNDQSTFLYLFTRLEGRINDYCSKLISQKKRKLKKWTNRRSWDILDEGDMDRIPFMKRVALLTDKGRGEYRLIKEYYDARNEIAHGGTVTPLFSIPDVYRETRRLYVALKP